MKKETRFKYNAFLSQLAKVYSVDVSDISAKFTVEPSVAQKLESKIQESTAFLTLINIIPVDEQSGEVLGLGVGSTIAGTTDTSSQERQPTDPTYIDGTGYKCTQTNFDTALPYAKLDLWAKFQDFQTRIRDAIIQRQALDRIMIGFNGTHRAKTSNRAANPMLQDVAVGWLQKYREKAPDRVMSKTTNDDGSVTEKVLVGKGRTYANLDALVMDATNNLIAPWYQEDPELVVICGRQLLADKYFPIVNQSQANTEQLAADLIVSQKRIGNLPAVRVPYFPANALMITRLDNLSIYWQEGTHRRLIDEVPKRDRIENYESINEDYVVEDYAAGCLVENIELSDAPVEAKAEAPAETPEA